MNLTIGKKESGALFHWPGGLEAVTQTFAILAKKGYGKSYVASVECEEMLKAGLQVVAIDPTGAWFGLQSSADGKSEGFPIVVFGGDHGNVPLEELAGEIVARAIVEQGFSCVIDLSLLRKGAANKLMGVFLETLYRLNRTPLHLIVDEADTFAPQRPFGEEARTLGAMEDIVKKGRRRGIGTTLITQRPQTINKNVLSQVDTLITGNLSHPKDIDAIMEWVNVHASKEEAQVMTQSLPSLRKEEKWVWSPGWGGFFERIIVRKRETFDSGATPKAGEKVAEPKKLAPIDIEVLGKAIAETVERKKAEDPKLLKARVAELEKKLSQPAKPIAPVTIPEPKRIEVPVLKDGQLNRIESFVEKLSGILESGKEMMADLTASMKKVNAPAPNVVQQKPPIRTVERALYQKPPVTPKVNTGDTGLSGPERRIVNAIAWMESLGIETPQKTAVAFLADYTFGSGGFNNPCGSLRSKGLIEYAAGNLIRLTDDGKAVAEYPDAVLTAEELQRHVLGRLPGPESKILTVLLASYPDAISKEACANQSGYTPGSGGFNNPCGKLRTLGLIDYPTPGHVRAEDLLFLL